jgi:hypothetical protein
MLTAGCTIASTLLAETTTSLLTKALLAITTTLLAETTTTLLVATALLTEAAAALLTVTATGLESTFARFTRLESAGLETAFALLIAATRLIAAFTGFARLIAGTGLVAAFTLETGAGLITALAGLETSFTIVTASRLERATLAFGIAAIDGALNAWARSASCVAIAVVLVFVFVGCEILAPFFVVVFHIHFLDTCVISWCYLA